MFDKQKFVWYIVIMKLDIGLGILITLLNKGKTSCKELAYKYDVSTRTIYRYVSMLDTAGVPVISKCGKNGGIEILNTFKLSNMFLTTQEKMTLITVCSHINNVDIRKKIQDKLLLIKWLKKNTTHIFVWYFYS